MRPGRRFQLSLVALVQLCLVNVGAAQLQWVGVSSERFDPVFSAQQNSQWCWAASIQMILNYYGINISQADIVRRSYGQDPYGQLPDWPGSWQMITENLNNWGIDAGGTRYLVRSMVGGGAPPPNLLLNELGAQRPVLLAYMTGPNSGHAVVGTAAAYTGSPWGPIVQQIVVRDPMPQTGGRKVYAGADIASRMSNYWLVYVERAY